MRKQLLTLIFILLTHIALFCQPKCHFAHYGAEDGLPQYTVMDILQDKKGFMWFSTWDGLSKFDGYNFSSYKMHFGDAYHMRSNRIDHIFEDKYGYIWTLSYDKEAHRFDPKTEKFMGIRSFAKYKDFNFTTRTIVPTSSGKVWLLSDNSGCICVKDSTFDITIFNIENKNLNAAKVFQVHEDRDRNTWILTDNGLYTLAPDGKTIIDRFAEDVYGTNKPMQGFYSSMELINSIWFASDKGKIWIYNKGNGGFKSFDIPTESKIKEVEQVDSDQIFIRTQNDGFFICNLKTSQSEHYTTANLPQMPFDSIISSYIDHSHNIWIETADLGVSKFDTQRKTMKHFMPKTEKLGSNVVFPPNFFIFEDNDKRLWVHPRGGGFSLYQSETDEIIPFYNEPSSPNWRFSSILHAAFSDKQGNLWLSTRSHGLDKIIFNYDFFENKIVDKNINSTINNDIRSIFEDHDQNLWISSKGGKIYVFNASQELVGYLCENGNIEFGEPFSGIAYSMMEDDAQNIWIATKGEGLYRLSPIQGTRNYRISNFRHNPYDKYSLSSNSVYSVFQDKHKRIWAGTYGEGLDLMDSEIDGKFYNHNNELVNYPVEFGLQVRSLADDKYGNICVGTTFGLIMFSPEFKDAKSIQFRSYTRFPDGVNSLSGNDIYDIVTTKTGETYLATFGGGLNHISETDEKGFPTQFISYTTKDGLPSDVLLTITEDNKGDLWIATEGNLTKFDPTRKTFETYSEVNRIIAGKNFSEGARFKSKSNIIHLGYSKGYISFNPDKIEHNKFKPYVALTDFQIGNKKVEVGENSPLKTNIDDAEFIKLNNNQNFITLEFTALDYVDPNRILYAYILDGFDSEWTIAEKRRTASYTNLPPGKYTFRVKSTNSDGVWMDNENTLVIEIVPSFWQTNWAYLLYFIVIAAILYLVLRSVFIFYRMRYKMQLEREQAEMKSRFFTDISHELRTPLTMILSPVENILESDNTPKETKAQLEMIKKNTDRLLRMVNKILDFRKLEKRKLSIQPTRLGDFVQSVCNNFAESARKKNISFSCKNTAHNDLVWIDRDGVEQLVFNLLSNALKFTPEDKSIEVEIFNGRKAGELILQVSDTGKGMGKDILSKIFTRFTSFNKDKSNPSTGIGLSIVKEVADKHHASIVVTSEIDKGSVFTITFLQGSAHFANDENVTYIDSENESPESYPNHMKTEEPNELLSPDVPKREVLLIVEDDNDLRGFIRTVLEPYYEVLEADNGAVAFDVAVKEIPDFIVSDIMMPEVDGLELLQKIRTSDLTSHIPFILLTAKIDIESKLDGLEYGADDYITKPFSVKYLRARIENIIRHRKRLSDYFTYRTTTEPEKLELDTAEPEHQITQQDESFLKRIKEITIQNVDDSTFLIDDLVTEMGMSRTVFFKKLKSLTGLAPVEFIRNIKIRYAALLIESQNYSIKEASFMIGISDTKYFTQCFKKIFGMTPSDYRTLKKKLKENPSE